MESLYKRRVISCVEERVGQAQKTDWSPRPLPDCLSTILGPGQGVHCRGKKSERRILVRHWLKKITKKIAWLLCEISSHVQHYHPINVTN